MIIEHLVTRGGQPLDIVPAATPIWAGDAIGTIAGSQWVCRGCGISDPPRETLAITRDAGTAHADTCTTPAAKPTGGPTAQAPPSPWGRAAPEAGNTALPRPPTAGLQR